MKISIIIPVFNSIKTLPNCLGTLKERDDLEIIIVDDASTDGSFEYCKKSGFKVIKLKQNEGVARARNAGAKESLGKYLFFLDSDIVVNTNIINSMFNYLDHRPSIHAIGAFASRNNLNKQFSSDFIHLRALWSAYLHKGDKVYNFSGFQSECGMIRRETFFNLGGFPETHNGVGSEEYHLGHNLSLNSFSSVLSLDFLYDTYWKTLPQRFLNLITRTRRWAPLFYNRWKLESQGTTGTVQEFWSCLLTGLFLILAFLILVLKLPLILFPIILIFHLLGESEFLLFVKREHSLKMMLFAWPAVQIINMAILTGFFLGTIDFLKMRKSYSN